MRDLVNKIQVVEERITAEFGPFDLLGLFLREESNDKWDLIISSEAARDNRKSATVKVSNILREVLSNEDILKISRIVILNEPIHLGMRVEKSIVEVNESNFFGLHIKKAYILAAK